MHIRLLLILGFVISLFDYNHDCDKKEIGL